MKFSLAIIVVLFSISAEAGYKEFFYQRFQTGNEKSSKDQRPNRERFFDQKLDHFSSDARVFKQRWYLNDGNALNRNAPVFFYICGEATCNASSVFGGATAEYAKMFNGIAIALEHRYYGKSQPFSSLSAESLRYLSTDQAIEDLRNFQESVSKELGLTGKWVAIGGSYPGNLAAYYKAVYPSLTAAALASSAPVRAKAEFNEYDEHVTKVVGPACADRMRQAVSEIEASLDSPERLEEIKRSFRAQEIKDPVDFLYVIADIGAIAAQYGYIERFCENLETADSPLQGYSRFANFIYLMWDMYPKDICIGEATSENPADYIKGFGMRQWIYQSCTEYGFWQTAHPVSSSRSSLISLEYHNSICERLFGIDTPVNTGHINRTYYAKLLQSEVAQNILFTNGSNDPWLNLSILPEDNSNPFLQSYLIPGAAHCDDLGTSRSGDSPELSFARMLFVNLLEKVL